MSERKGKSPYRKYDKAPYKYRFPNCSHRLESGASRGVRQNVVTPIGPWSGVVCGGCGIILLNSSR